jgi:hypothetical protein
MCMPHLRAPAGLMTTAGRQRLRRTAAETGRADAQSPFRSYTLLSLSKKVAESDLRWYGAKNAQQASPVQQQMLRNSVRTQDAYIPNRQEVMRSQ